VCSHQTRTAPGRVLTGTPIARSLYETKSTSLNRSLLSQGCLSRLLAIPTERPSRSSQPFSILAAFERWHCMSRRCLRSSTHNNRCLMERTAFGTPSPLQSLPWMPEIGTQQLSTSSTSGWALEVGRQCHLSEEQLSPDRSSTCGAGRMHCSVNRHPP